MMPTPLVSVIVPIYNVENYLARCISSITNQTYLNLEIICIDDLSLDNSLTVLKNLQKSDSRIKILYHDKNRGLGGARNTGINAASGEFICFIDSDDEIEENYISDLLESMTKHNADMVFCDLIHIDTSSVNLRHKKPFHDFDVAFDCYDAQKDLRSLVDIWPSAWNKLYRTEIIKKNKIYYRENELYEDHAFYYRYLSVAKKIYYLPKSLYRYRIKRPGQITSEASPRIFDIFSVLTQLRDILKTTLTESSAFSMLYSRICLRLLFERYVTLKTNSSLRKEFVGKSRDFLNQFEFKDIKKSKDCFIPISCPIIPKPIYCLIYHKNDYKYFREYVIFGLKLRQVKLAKITQDLSLMNCYMRNIKNP